MTLVLILSENVDATTLITLRPHVLLDARVLSSFKFGLCVVVLHLASPHDVLLPGLDLLGKARDVLEAVQSQNCGLVQDLHALVVVVPVDDVLSLVSRLSQDPIAYQKKDPKGNQGRPEANHNLLVHQSYLVQELGK